MSVNVNQYLMYGVQLDPKKVTDDFYDKYESFMNDSAYKSEVNHVDGIFCCFDGMNGRFIIVGKVIEKAEEGELINGPIEISYLLGEKERSDIAESIRRNFADDLPLQRLECKYIFVTKYR